MPVDTSRLPSGRPGWIWVAQPLVDEHRQPKAILDRNEQKSLQTDRVVLRPGPPEEVEVVRRLYRMFVVQRRIEREIAATLNAENIRTDLSRPWTRGTVHQVLTNEKYIGNNVYNRASFKLQMKRVVNPPDMWVRHDAAFEPIVEQDFFEAAQRIIQDRSRRYSDQELLERLSAIFSEKGWLSGLIIDEMDDMPSSSTFRHRFGSLVRAYQLVGYTPPRDYRYIETNRTLRALHPDVVNQVIDIEHQGSAVRRDPISDLLHINEEFSASLVIARCHISAAGGPRWKVRFDHGLRPSITITARMDEVNTSIRDYYLLPWLEAGRTPTLRLAPENGIFRYARRLSGVDEARASTGGGVNEDEPEIRSIPVDLITVLNPRARNKRIFQELVDRIANLGLKKPITVSKRPGRTRYDLVCGQGRLEAFIALGETEIPALVVEASEEHGYIMSLVENLARRQHRPLELVHAIGALAGLGYSHAEIANKVPFSVEYIVAICVLLERGEEKLISAVERGVIPHTIATEIARAKEGEVQQALAQAYEERKIPSNQVLAIRQIIEQRNNSGKQLHARGRRAARPRTVKVLFAPISARRKGRNCWSSGRRLPASDCSSLPTPCIGYWQMTILSRCGVPRDCALCRVLWLSASGPRRCHD
jgi:ParB/RepB/Spo0J family partition protein